jgi:small-conductance mechanosensitive channel
MSSFNDPSNPYQAGIHEPSMGASGVNHLETLNAWRATGKWQTFFSVLGFIATALIAVFVPISAIAGRNGEAAAGMIGVFVLMIPVTILCYLIPSILLFKAGASTRLIGASDAETFSKIAKSQKSFWRYIGILAIIVLVIYAVFIPLGILLTLTSVRA